jgi:hypothetical protein
LDIHGGIVIAHDRPAGVYQQAAVGGEELPPRFVLLMAFPRAQKAG